MAKKSRGEMVYLNASKVKGILNKNGVSMQEASQKLGKSNAYLGMRVKKYGCVPKSEYDQISAVCPEIKYAVIKNDEGWLLIDEQAFRNELKKNGLTCQGANRIIGTSHDYLRYTIVRGHIRIDHATKLSEKGVCIENYAKTKETEPEEFHQMSVAEIEEPDEIRTDAQDAPKIVDSESIVKTVEVLGKVFLDALVKALEGVANGK